MGWNISHVSMKESQSLLHAQSSLHELQSGFAGQSQGETSLVPWAALTAGFPVLVWGMTLVQG